MGSNTKVMIPRGLESTSSGAMVDCVQRIVSMLRTTRPDDAVLTAMMPTMERVFLSSDDTPRRILMEEARQNMRLSDLLVGRIFPDVARLLETGWNSDRLSFVDVTIAATRLQDFVRSMGRFSLPSADAKSVVMVVPPWEQHSLPAVFAAEQLRTMGAPTRLMSGVGARELVSLINRVVPSAIMISVASYRSLARAPELVESLRRGVPHAIPIVIGGPAHPDDPSGYLNVGADFATNDLGEALKFCNFDLSDTVHEVAFKPV
ncbi:MAG: hypothetical protein WBA67_14945 [Jannaschia sp.]